MNARIARAIKAARGDRSAQVIADETARLGFPITRDTIANIENGRKKSVDVPELIVLAKALGVPPLRLIYPDLVDSPVQAYPGVDSTSGDAALAFSGYDDEDMRMLFDLRAARDQYERYGMSDNEIERDNARQTRSMAERFARNKGWVVNDG
ncbi:hypothetical protein AU188_03975 [Mycobacterium sp. IS-3022]|nr:hypothetical protein AU188_03975 [Mycobacterium sp. IS-3022]